MIQEKKCSKCGEVKHLKEFYSKHDTKDGLTTACIDCIKVKVRAYRKTKRGLVSEIYGTQRLKSKKRGHHPPVYSNQELQEWCFSQKLFHELYDNWESSGFKSGLRPSCDRKNDYKGYFFDNIQIVTWDENNRRGYDDRKNGINNKQSKSVMGTHTITGNIIEFHSTREAERITGIQHTNISACCKGKVKTASGYKWRYANG